MDTMKHIGGYVVIHHGLEGEEQLPLMLVDFPRGGAHPHTYTANIARAKIFGTYIDAKCAAEDENERLKGEEHPLAGKIEVGELFVRDYEPKGEEDGGND